MGLELSGTEAAAVVVAAGAAVVAGRGLPLSRASFVAAAGAVVVSAIIGELSALGIVAAVVALGLFAGALGRHLAHTEDALDDATRRAVAAGRQRAGTGAVWRNPDGLSPREVEVLALIADGRSNQEIADALVVSMATVKTHVNHVFTKTGARDRAQAVRYAYEQGVRGASTPPPQG